MALDWAIRYAPMVSFIRSRRPKSILEVGSGPQGIAYFLTDTRVVGTDIRFGERPLPNVLPTISSSIALPFRNRSFDLVLSSDMMEHLPENLRQNAMEEMLRVAVRYVIVGFPSGSTAKTHDMDIMAWLNRWSVKIPVWLSEHLEHDYPTSKSLLRALPLESIGYRVESNANWRIHKVLVALQTSYYFNWFVKRFRLDNINLILSLDRILNRGRTYREIIFLDANNASL